MNLRRLKYFVEIVESGSLTQASAVLYIAQPALSQQISTLESELNHQLLIRNKRGVVPTAAGQLLYQHALNILELCALTERAIENFDPMNPTNSVVYSGSNKAKLLSS